MVSQTFQEVNRISVLSFENEAGSREHAGYYLPKVGEMKDSKSILIVENILISQEIMTEKHIKSFKKLLQVKEMAIQRGACLIIHTSEKSAISLE